MEQHSEKEFQFHKGTIKTLPEMLTVGELERYFNSIKVQLKLNLTILVIDTPIFQFHKGTIKT